MFILESSRSSQMLESRGEVKQIFEYRLRDSPFSNRRRIFPDNTLRRFCPEKIVHLEDDSGTVDRMKRFWRISPMEHEGLTFVARYPISEPPWKFHVKLGHRYFISETRASFRLENPLTQERNRASPVTLSADVQNKEHYLPNLWTPADAWWIS